MSEIYSLLSIDKSTLDGFSNQGALVYDNNLQSVLDKAIRKLKNIAMHQPDSEESRFDQNSIDEVVKKINHCVNNQIKTSSNWKSSELRILSYNIDRFSSEEIVLDFAIRLLKFNWRSSYANGLTYTILSHWHSMGSGARSRCYDLLSIKLTSYDGKSKRLLFLQDHLNLLSENGTIRFSKLIEVKSIPIISSPVVLGFQPSAINLEYFSDVLISYYSGVKSLEFTEIDDILKVHTYPRTKKLIAVNMVEYADKLHDEGIQNRVSQYLNNMLGSITLPSTWAPYPNATVSEIERLEHACELVKIWLAQKVIEVFFEYISEPERKKYWLKWSTAVKDFKIVGSYAFRYRLAHDHRVKDVYQSFFIPLDSGKDTTAALVLYIKDRVFVEFSEIGNALYIYKKDDPFLESKFYNKKIIKSISDLKKTNWHMVAIQSYQNYWSFRDDGKLLHIGNWQNRLDNYMAKKASSSLVDTLQKKAETTKKYQNASSWFANGRCRIVQEGTSFKIQLLRNDGEIGIYTLHTYRSTSPKNGKIEIRSASTYNTFQVEYVISSYEKLWIGYITVLQDRVKYSRKLDDTPMTYRF